MRSSTVAFVVLLCAMASETGVASEASEARVPANPKCHERQDSGPCHQWVLKYFYHKRANRCRKFYYGGCGGTNNRFDTERLCHEACEPHKLKPKIAKPTKLAIGEPRVKSSRTRGEETSAAFGSVETNEILPTREKIERKEKNHRIEEVSACERPADEGSCYDYKLRWYYNSTDKTCHHFWYGGCGGNANRFPNKTDCIRSCSSSEPSGKSLIFAFARTYVVFCLLLKLLPLSYTV
ncbi:collagen alpha-3(vi) chain [Plakobranchus ocellatus]|uniref:Collagen alpha-3(Vi) chain n=1 Tax=Plakobranchus ocellatus TaxID=259542 RepID=A0AAV4CUB1_9GAST|nr:collagen alpha-3(vi) chain [Plakobranchus ocellatus]